MRKIAILGGLVLCAFIVLQWSFSKPRAQADTVNCKGTQFEGAWFKVQIPAGMTAVDSLPSSSGEGADSIWVSASAGNTQFYAYAPQWAGTPYDIFLGARDRRELSRKETENKNRTELELQYEDAVGKFQIVQSNDPVSHLTTGYRTKTGDLSPEELQQYACFKGSIDQFSD
jgi:hypothetical protein